MLNIMIIMIVIYTYIYIYLYILLCIYKMERYMDEYIVRIYYICMLDILLCAQSFRIHVPMANNARKIIRPTWKSSHSHFNRKWEGIDRRDSETDETSSVRAVCFVWCVVNTLNWTYMLHIVHWTPVIQQPSSRLNIKYNKWK